MEINPLPRAGYWHTRCMPPKLLLKMKLLTFFMIVTLTQVWAEGYSQKITLNKQKISIESALKAIEKQSEYLFLYDKSDLPTASTFSLRIKNGTIQNTLDQLFEGLPLSYKVFDKNVVIRKEALPMKKEAVPLPATPTEPVKKVTNRSVSGKVVDEKGESLPGVSILIKGTQQGTVSDVNGSFSLETPDQGAVLVFSFVGYLAQEIEVGAQTSMEVTLKVDEKSLDEVVVVGFGTQRKITVTGAVASVQTKEVKQSPAANLAVSLAGRLPGLTSIQRSGEPGRDETLLFIRGQGTVNSQSPIILVDGIERGLTYIDPNEVESVTILKDASSTAIFGVRGANGVILVTTRRGTSEVPEINFTAEGSAQDFTREMSPVNSFEFATLRNQAQRNDGLGDAFSAEALERYRLGDDPTRYPNTNWRNIILKDYSLQQRYNLNISGAGKMMRYFVNAGVLDQGGQFKTEKDLPYDPSFKMKRYNFRSNIDMQLNKSLKAFLNVAGYLEKQNMPNPNGTAGYSPALNILASMLFLPATVPGPVTPDGEVLTSPQELLPAYGKMNRSGYIQQSRSNVMATYGMEQSLDFLTKGLSVKAIVSFDSRATNNLLARRTYETYTQVIDPNLKGQDGRDSIYYRRLGDTQNTPLSISGEKAYSTLSNFQGYVNYDREFGKHEVSGLLLYQQQKDIRNEELPYNLLGLASRLKYGYDNRYFLEFNAGFNGSEQFAKGNRFGFFPAISGSWVVSNEKFLANHRTINNLKIRASYGEVGNDRIGSRRFLYMDDIQVVGGGPTSSLGRGQLINISLLKNQELQWEVAKKTNIGLELGLFNSLNLMVDVFYENRDNILRSRGTIPVLNGFPNSVIPPVNIGVIKNKGYEIELNYRKAIQRDFSILGKLNLNYATNRQVFADEPLLPEAYAYRNRQTGYRIGQLFGYLVDRYFESEQDIANSPQQNVGTSPKPGDFKYKDLNEDGVINEQDQAPIGYSNVPEYTFGAAFNVTYKNFDVSVLFQGVTNVTNYYNSYGTFPEGNYLKTHLESWTQQRFENGDPINYPRLTLQSSPSQIPNSFFMRDASYLRLKNLEIGYRLPAHLTEKIKSKGVRIYANGLNLVTWDRLPTRDIDPELVYNLSYPITRLYNVGINVTF